MPTTTNYGFYSPPLTGVTPNVPRDVKTLADAVDVALKAEETARIAEEAARIAGDALRVFAPDSDAGFPAAANGATTATVVIDRFTVAAAPYERRAHFVTNCYVTVSVTDTQLNLTLFAGSTNIGYGRKNIEGVTVPDTMVASGKYTIPASTAVVFEARIARQSGTGAFSTSTSSFLTNSNLLLIAA